jgi:hypothetical protein
MALSLKPAHIGAGLQVLDAAWQQSLNRVNPVGQTWRSQSVHFMSGIDF